VTWNVGTLAAGAAQQCVSLSVQLNSSAAQGATIANPSSIDSDETGPAFANEDTLVCTNQPPVADPNGPYVFPLNAGPFDGTGSFDPDSDPLTYNWDFGDGNTGSGATPSHTYAEAGIYDVCLTVNDGYVDSEQVCTMAVIYDPSAGFVTGGGWIDSPAGAYKPDTDLAGKANFGFVSKYKKGADVPEGNTEFQFHAGDLNFHSSSYEWLVVTGSDYAMFKGTGTINGEGAYKFRIWAGDDEPDTFRIKIWEEDEYGTETVTYDNGFDQAISGGSIVIHTKKK
jgi:PKD repeat protein